MGAKFQVGDLVVCTRPNTKGWGVGKVDIVSNYDECRFYLVDFKKRCDAIEEKWLLPASPLAKVIYED